MEELRLLGILGALATVGIALVHLIGVVVAGVLVARKAGRGAALALAGFGLLFVNTACGAVSRSLILPQLVSGRADAFPVFQGGLSCIGALLTAIAMGLLIASIWSALSRTAAYTVE